MSGIARQTRWPGIEKSTFPSMQPSILTFLPADNLFYKYGWALCNSAASDGLEWVWSTHNIQSFKQYCQQIFDGPLTQKEQNIKATYVLLWIGEEVRKIFNSFELSDEEKQKSHVIFDKFTTYVEPKWNFRIAWYQLQVFRQSAMNQMSTLVHGQM